MRIGAGRLEGGSKGLAGKAKAYPTWLRLIVDFGYAGTGALMQSLQESRGEEGFSAPDGVFRGAPIGRL
jgi:hypothetical protein